MKSLLVVLALLPASAFASGFYLPWWGEALFFLLLTPAGWSILAALLVVLVLLAYRRLK